MTPEGVSFQWTGGKFGAPTSHSTSFTCTYPGVARPTLIVSRLGCEPVMQAVPVSCTDADCVDCLFENCGAPQGGPDVFEMCVRNSDPLFAQRCVDAYVCSLTSDDDCAFDVGRGAISCYCGTDRSIEDCFAPSSPTTGPAGRCIGQWEAAAACAAGDSECVADRFVDLTFPSGFANYAAVCTVQCASACGYSAEP